MAGDRRVVEGPGIRELGYERMEYALVAESNEASRSTVERFDGKLCRTFGVYEKELADGVGHG